MDLLTIIPAREGSKRVRRKNVRDFCGRPLVEYTIRAAVDAGVFGEIIVSTDISDLRQRVAPELSDKFRILDRAASLAEDAATVMDVANHVLDELNPSSCDYVFIMLPTCPMRNSGHITKAVTQLVETLPDGLISVTDYFFPIKFAMHFDSERGTLSRNMRAMDATAQYYVDNGGFYALKPQSIRSHDYLPDGSVPFVMERWASIDIDDEQDWRMAEAMYRHFVNG